LALFQLTAYITVKARRFRDQYTRFHKILKKLKKNNAKIKIKINNLIAHFNRLWIFYIKSKSNEIIFKELKECCSLTLKIINKSSSMHRRKQFSESGDPYLSPPLKETSIYTTTQGLKTIKYDQLNISHDENTFYYLCLYRVSFISCVNLFIMREIIDCIINWSVNKCQFFWSTISKVRI